MKIKKSYKRHVINTPELEMSFFYKSDINPEMDVNDLVKVDPPRVGQIKDLREHLDEFQKVFQVAVYHHLTSYLVLGTDLDDIPPIEEMPPIAHTPDFDIAKLIEEEDDNKEKAKKREEFESNVKAFEVIEKQLRKDPNYRGKYIVIYKGRPIASGTDRARLISETYQKYGYVSLIVEKIGEKQIMRIYSPRFKRDG
jgi:hypothetical protein